MDALKLSLLDRFTLERASEPLDLPVGTQKLLAFLALRGTSHRSVVAGTLWPDVPEDGALASLRTAVWRVKKLLPDLIRPEGPAIEISASVEVDSRQQEDFTTALLCRHLVDLDQVGAGLRVLWPSALLPGWYDDWVIYERERLGQLRVHALEAATRLFVGHRELDTALRLALEAVRAEPLRETANAALMSVYLAEGNVCDAIHQFEQFDDLLHRELGVAPSPRLAAMLPRRTEWLAPL